MTTNNYDTCIEMEDCELACYYDGDLASMDWRDNFKVIQHDGYRSTAIYLYTGMDEMELPRYASELIDLSEVTEKEAREFCRQYFNGSFADCVRWKMYVADTWKDAAIELLDKMDLAHVITDGIPDIGEPLFNVVSIRGYSQGDYALVLYQHEESGFLSDEETARKVFQNLCFDAPVCCRLTVDGEEHFLDHYLSDSYEWDKDEVLEGAKKQGLSEAVLEWLGANLPEHPDYI